MIGTMFGTDAQRIPSVSRPEDMRLRGFGWLHSDRSLGIGGDPGQEIVEVRLPRPGTDPQVLRLMAWLERRLSANDATGRIMRSVGSFFRGTTVTMEMPPTQTADLIAEMSALPEVEAVVMEEPPVPEALHGLVGVPPVSLARGHRPVRRIHLELTDGATVTEQ